MAWGDLSSAVALDYMQRGGRLAPVINLLRNMRARQLMEDKFQQQVGLKLLSVSPLEAQRDYLNLISKGLDILSYELPTVKRARQNLDKFLLQISQPVNLDMVRRWNREDFINAGLNAMGSSYAILPEDVKKELRGQLEAAYLRIKGEEGEKTAETPSNIDEIINKALYVK